MLEILYEDAGLIAINKPAGLLVHRTRIAAEEQHEFAIQMLRDQIGVQVHPVHRLDRATSGVLLFTKNRELIPLIEKEFAERRVKKTYLALVRGVPREAEGTFDRPLESERSKRLQEAITRFKILCSAEIPFDTTGRYPSSRYALLELSPETGRTHQIRRHLAQARHYIIGDKKHGDNKQNKFFESQFKLQKMLLHAHTLDFTHPIENELIRIKAELPVHFRAILMDIGIKEEEVSNLS
jgi:tRNA pseudouridine65 synthase